MFKSIKCVLLGCFLLVMGNSGNAQDSGVIVTPSDGGIIDPGPNPSDGGVIVPTDPGNDGGTTTPVPQCRYANLRGAQLSWPALTSKKVSQGFGAAFKGSSCGFYTGIAIPAATKPDVALAIADGAVAYVGPLWLNGPKIGRGPYAVVINHGNGAYSTYSHNSQAFVKAGQCVVKGQPIALIGSEGYVTDGQPLLHFEILENTSWTGNWKSPFSNACKSYKNPLSYAFGK